jgi:predicted DNA-binding protein
MNKKPRKATAAELRYIEDMKRTNAFEKLDHGEAKILSMDEYPAPLRRLIERERRMVRLTLSPALKRRLDALSAAEGVSEAELVKRWVEERLEREAG